MASGTGIAEDAGAIRERAKVPMRQALNVPRLVARDTVAVHACHYCPAAWTSSLVAARQSLTVASSHPAARVRPSEENATDRTLPPSGLSVSNSSPVNRSHNFTVVSSLTEAKVRPSGENAMALTLNE